MIPKARVLWMDLLLGDGAVPRGLNPLYLLGLADHLLTPPMFLICQPVWMMWVCVCWAGLATVGSLVDLVSLFRSCPTVGVLGRFGLPADPD
ncbi:hypothetical protein Nepgr_018745 [Nepenthes gracilis]|uniref:Uncharacterized protein n=1 Tax=Nepenthes gracilis TaxID=150966 RepID=A0AAD3XUB6_NEPGR|nr:hypothetical protein Nepgr_018745 [Nepenthes gracilis]